MFAYELQQARQSELQRRAAEWRLARDAKAARTARRRARRAQARSAVRTDAEGAPSPGSHRRPLGRLRRAPHPRGAA
ncbi:hypothetical protein OG552_26155 [Streptomyces sp. NBC_01476]|uniref:hypothetical protein n=1 Tax=Streptomyces sp. NBC_01476 TaxID=2903881 RepID=UPI002E365BC8|nr:hypothetical protein [Streptomyces sp. NBC_01476]